MIPVLRVRPGVHFDRIAPGGFRLLAALDGATKVIGMDLWITCGTEAHASRDPHTSGEAYDCSVKDMTVPLIIKAHRHLQQVLGERFAVLYEVPTLPEDRALAAIAFVNAEATGPHFHLQRRKGTVYPPAVLEPSA